MNKEVNNLLDRIINIGYTRLSDKLQLEQCIKLAKEIKLKDMNHYKEALENIADFKKCIPFQLASTQTEIVNIAIEALSTEVTEPRRFSLEEMREAFDYGKEFSVEDTGSKYFERFLESLSPKEGKEVKCPSCLGFGYGGEDEFTFKCKRCNGTGKEKAIFPSPPKEPNQTEAEGKSLRKIATEIMDQEYSFFTPETRRKMVLSFCQGHSLARKQVIEEIEEWAKENHKRPTYNKVDPNNTYKFAQKELLTKLSKLKITK